MGAAVSNEAITYLVAACCGVAIIAAYVAFILIPAWTAYERLWERLVAAVLTLYVLVAFLGLGVLAGGTVVWYWDRISV
jgi:predicted PurR-regulated permease PerM